MSYDDDEQIGQVLTRREVLALFGTAGMALLAACVPNQAATTSAPTTAPSPTALASSTSAAATPTVARTPLAAATSGALPACIVRPAQTEGPYFVDTKLNRSDIRSNPADNAIAAGVPLKLVLQVSQLTGNACAPLPGALVDVWQCDALGVYSGVQGSAGAGKQFLRGYQVTDATGAANFVTIYPGWYTGRAVHIHFKIRTGPEATRGSEFTSQLYFDDALSDQVFTQPPYNTRGSRTTRNSNDGIYRTGGDQLLLAVTPDGEGYSGVFGIGLQTA